MTNMPKPPIDPKALNLRRMLYLVAVSNNQEPTTANIRNLMMSKFPDNFPGSIDYDNVKSRCGHANTKKPSFPKEDVANSYLRVLNNFFFVENSNEYFPDFDIDLGEWEIWQTHGAAVESEISKNHLTEMIHGVLIISDYHHIRPVDLIEGQIPVARKDITALNAHLLYHTPLAALLWDNIKTAPSYKAHYWLCEKGLKELLNKPSVVALEDGEHAFSLKEQLCQRRLVFNFGAGSYIKDKLILACIQKCTQDMKKKDENVPPSVYCWVEAAHPMLARTLAELSAKDYFDVYKLALETDFEDPSRIKELYEQFRKIMPSLPHYSTKKIFFILGYTLSNLREEHFFDQFAKSCQPGDLFVFPIQFIPEECREDKDKYASFQKSVVDNYDFEEGRMLASAGLSQTLKFKPVLDQQLRPEACDCLLNNKSGSFRIIFRAQIKSTESFGSNFSVVTAETYRHYENDYKDFLASKGFSVVDQSQVHQGVRTLVVEYKSTTLGY